MIKAEWASIFANRFLVIVLLAIMLIPSIYSVIFLGSMWDPYGKTGQLPVAIVNEDKSVVYGGEELSLGSDLTTELINSDTLQFSKVSNEQGEKGLEEGIYFMVFVIPEDFSKNATTTMDKNPQPMELNYFTSQGHSFIASKFSESAALKIEDQVSKEVTKMYTTTLLDKFKDMKSGIQTAANGAKDLSSGTAQAVDGSGELKSGLSSLAKGLRTYTNGEEELANGLDLLNARAKPLSSGVNDLSNGAQQALDGAKTLSSGANSLKTGIDSYTGGVKSASDGADELSTKLVQIAGVTQEIYDALRSLDGELAVLDDDPEFLQASHLLDIIVQIAGQVNDGAAELADGSTVLANGLDALDSKSPELQNGASGVANGLQGLVAGEQKVVDGANRLKDSTPGLLMGIQALDDGANTLRASNSELINGSKTLRTGSKQLTDGLVDVNSGASQLSTKLLDASHQLVLVNTDSANASAVANPIQLNQHETASVANNGTGMAPYMLSVALFVGAVVINLMYDIFTPRRKPKTAFSWFLAKASVLSAVGIFQALLMWIFMQLVDGFSPLNSFATLGVLFLESLTFMSIVGFFNLTLKKVGSFMMLIFLVLQLSGSAGTYPIVLSDPFYNAIHPFLPMTYGINALRETISIGGPVGVNTVVLVVLIAVFSVLSIVYLGFARKKVNPVAIASVG
ncbi:phage infection protein [Actinomycetota bacterium]|nr:phage infection protein [Actinomycetota bacterium]